MTAHLAYETPWTSNRVHRLRTLWLMGTKLSEIVATFEHQGISRSAVLGKIYRMKLPRRRAEGQFRSKWTDERLQYIRKAWSVTDPEWIAACLGISVGAVKAKASRLRLRKSSDSTRIAAQF